MKVGPVCCLERTEVFNLMSQKSTIKAFYWTREMAPFILMWCFPHQGHGHLRGFTNPDGPSGE